MYFGSYPILLDGKGRIAFSRKWYDHMKLHDHLVWFITRGYAQCLYLFNLETWEQLVARLDALDAMDPKTHKFLRFLYGNAIDARVDPQARLFVPTHLRNLIGLERKVCLVGMKSHIELWRTDEWDRYQASNIAEYESMATDLLIRSPQAGVGQERGGGHDGHRPEGNGTRDGDADGG